MILTLVSRDVYVSSLCRSWECSVHTSQQPSLSTPLFQAGTLTPVHVFSRRNSDVVLSAETCGTEVLIIFSPSELLSLRVTDSSPTHTRSMSDDKSEVSFVLQWRGRVIVLCCHSSPRTSPTRICVDKCVFSKLSSVLFCTGGSDLGAVRSGQGRHHVTGAVKTQRGGVPCVCRRILVVGVEAQPLPAITHVVQREPRTERVRRTGGAAVVTRTQLVQ